MKTIYLSTEIKNGALFTLLPRDTYKQIISTDPEIGEVESENNIQDLREPEIKPLKKEKKKDGISTLWFLVGFLLVVFLIRIYSLQDKKKTNQ